MDDKGQIRNTKPALRERNNDDFVLEKSIFSNVFDKDIRRIYLYKKAERLARALHLISPAFGRSDVLKTRVEQIAIGLIDSATLPVQAAKEHLSRELLALSGLLSLARTSGMLSHMNADLITRESHVLLEEVASYEEPRLTIESVPSLAAFSKTTTKAAPAPKIQKARSVVRNSDKGHVSDKPHSNRREAIINVLETQGPSYIKDISIIVRDVSEKTIQRELQSLVGEGVVKKEGDRRWTRYSLPISTPSSVV